MVLEKGVTLHEGNQTKSGPKPYPDQLDMDSSLANP